MCCVHKSQFFCVSVKPDDLVPLCCSCLLSQPLDFFSAPGSTSHAISCDLRVLGDFCNVNTMYSIFFFLKKETNVGFWSLSLNWICGLKDAGILHNGAVIQKAREME